MSADGEVDWLHHGNETRLGVGDVEALDVEVKGNWTDVGMEAEEAVSRSTQPLTEVLGVSNRRAESNDPNLTLNLGRDVTHSGAHHFQYGL